MTKFHLVTIVVIILLSFFSNAQAQPNKLPKMNEIIIGFSNAAETDTWKKFMVANFKAEITKHPEIAKYFYRNAKDRPYKQRRDIDELLEKEIDVLIVQATTETGINSAIEKAYDQGIPVIVFGTGIKGTEKYTTEIVINSYQMGKLQAEWLTKELNYKGNIIMFSGIKGNESAEDRLKGARSVFKQYPEIKILSFSYEYWRMDLAKKKMHSLIKQHQKIDGIWGDSGLSSWPALQVLKESGRPLVPSTGDQLNGYAKFLVKNNLRGFIYPIPSSISRFAVQYGIKAVQGETIPKAVEISVKTYGPEKIKELVQMNKSDFWWIGDDQMPEEFLPVLE